MTHRGVLARTGRAAVVSAAIISLGAACSGGQTRPSPPTAPTGGPATPGKLDVEAPGIDLSINDAVAHIGSAGDGDLTMTVRNNGSVPEHLAMVATPKGGRATLQSDSSANGSLSTSGILIRPGTAVVFAGQGPRIALPRVQGVTAGHTLPLTLQFGVAGLVHLQARVSTR